MSPLPSGTGPPPDSTTAYGDDPDQVYDVRLPIGSAVGCTAVLVHGGFWRPAYDRAHTGPQSKAFSDGGFHVATVEYRRSASGGWSAMAADVRAALRAVRADTGMPDGLVLVGHSAGGHLVAWLLHQAEAVGVRGAVSLAGCVDLALVDRLHLDNGAAQDLMGCTPREDPARWAAADPALLGPPPVPLVLLHGTADERVPLAVSQAYVERYPKTPLHVLDGCTHFDLIDPQSRFFAPTIHAAQALAGG